jgi:phosphoglycolate phosphatase
VTRRFFLDLDGTLLDPRRRLYSLFRELAPAAPWSFDDYWRMKRDQITQRQLLVEHLRYTTDQVERFRVAWLDKVEELARLELDVPFDGVSGFLANASKQVALYLVTARQFSDRALAQVRRWGWECHFCDVMVTGGRRSKVETVRSRVTPVAGDVWVGDTGEDVLAGKELGMRTVAVTCGLLSELALRGYHPDLVLDSVVELAPSSYFPVKK